MSFLLKPGKIDVWLEKTHHFVSFFQLFLTFMRVQNSLNQSKFRRNASLTSILPTFFSIHAGFETGSKVRKNASLTSTLPIILMQLCGSENGGLKKEVLKKEVLKTRLIFEFFPTFFFKDARFELVELVELKSGGIFVFELKHWKRAWPFSMFPTFFVNDALYFRSGYNYASLREKVRKIETNDAHCAWSKSRM